MDDDVTSRALVFLSVLYRASCSRARSSFPNVASSIKGNNGLSGFNFGPSQFQNLLYLAGYDPSHPPFTAPCGSDTACVLPYLGHVRNSKSSFSRDHRWTIFAHIGDHKLTVNSIVLLTNGISFAIQAVLLLTIGGWADYGTWRCARIEYRNANGD
jgi:hypothetical protein